MLAVDIRSLERRFSSFTLGPLDLSVPEGSIYGFIGPNGAGKTTTIDVILGMGLKGPGEITVLGLNNIRDEVAMKSQVGYVSPELNYTPWGTIAKAIMFVKGFYPTWDDRYCEQLMSAFGLAPREKIATLSFGSKIKLSLLLALSWRPKLIILDEPTVGLDAISKQAVFEELLRAVADEGRTVMISSHNLADIERITDHVGMIKRGRMVFEGSTADIVDRYRMVDFASAANDVDGIPGMFVQQRDADRWRALVDIKRTPLEQLRDRGATNIAATPVTLEDIFVSVGR